MARGEEEEAAIEPTGLRELDATTRGLVPPWLAAMVTAGGLAMIVASWLLLVRQPAAGPPTPATILAYLLGIVGFAATLLGGFVTVGVLVITRRRRRSAAEIAAVDAATAAGDSAGLARVLEQNADPVVQRHVGKALRALKPPYPLEPLFSLFDHPAIEVRRSVVGILGRSGDARAAEGLVSALRDVDAEVRGSAIDGLRRLRARGLPEEPRRAACVDEAIAEMTSENLIRTILGGGDFELRRAALLTLVREGRPTEVLVLTGIAILTEEPRIRALALEALDLRGAAERVLVLLRSWRSEGALLAMAGAMTVEQSLVANDVEAAILMKRPMATAAGK